MFGTVAWGRWIRNSRKASKKISRVKIELYRATSWTQDQVGEAQAKQRSPMWWRKLCRLCDISANTNCDCLRVAIWKDTAHDEKRRVKDCYWAIDRETKWSRYNTS